MVSAVAIATQNFKCHQFRDSNVSVIVILPHLIAMRVVLCATCGTSIGDLRAGGIPDTLPSLIILEQVVDALVKERTGNKFGDQYIAHHKRTNSRDLRSTRRSPRHEHGAQRSRTALRSTLKIK